MSKSGVNVKRTFHTKTARFIYTESVSFFLTSCALVLFEGQLNVYVLVFLLFKKFMYSRVHYRLLILSCRLHVAKTSKSLRLGPKHTCRLSVMYKFE